MSELIAYAVVTKNRRWGERPVTMNAQLPIFWNRRIAESEAEGWGGGAYVVRVTIPFKDAEELTNAR